MARRSLDPWSVLGVDRGASLDEVRAARRRRAKAVHPDHGGDPAAMLELNAAFDDVVRSILHPTAAADRRDGTDPARTDPARTDPARTDPARTDSDRTDPARTDRARRRWGIEHDDPSFTVNVLPVDAFEALLVVATWIGEVLVDDPPYLLDVHLYEPAPCWCRLELVPEAGGTSVNLAVGPPSDGEATPNGRSAVPSVEEVRDVWVAHLNRL